LVIIEWRLPVHRQTSKSNIGIEWRAPERNRVPIQPAPR